MADNTKDVIFQDLTPEFFQDLTPEFGIRDQLGGRGDLLDEIPVARNRPADTLMEFRIDAFAELVRQGPGDRKLLLGVA